MHLNTVSIIDVKLGRLSTKIMAFGRFGNFVGKILRAEMRYRNDYEDCQCWH